MAKVECLMVGNVVIHGVPSRTVYIFDTNNKIREDIKEEDLLDLLNKRERMGGCCGATEVLVQMFRLIE